MSKGWISASDLAHAVWKEKKPSPPPNSITERAYDGLLDTEAETFIRRTGNGAIRLDVCPIPTSFWRGERMIPNWDTGDFLAWVREEDGEFVEWKVYGVKFAKSGLDDFLKTASSEIAISQTPAAAPNILRHNPGKYDWARAVGSIIFEWADSGSWHPESQAEIEGKLAAWFSKQPLNKDGSLDIPDKKLLRKYGKWLLGEFERRVGE